MKIWDLEKANYEGNANIDADFVTKLIVAVAQLHDVADHKVCLRRSGRRHANYNHLFCHVLTFRALCTVW